MIEDIKSDLRLIKDHMDNGDLILAADALDHFIELHPRFYPQNFEIENFRVELGKFQQRWQGSVTVSEEDHMEWIKRGMVFLQMVVVLEQEIQVQEEQAAYMGGFFTPPLDTVPEHQWYDSGVLRITVQGSPYFLQGLHATLFYELVRAPLFLEQLPQNVDVRKMLIEDLAIALATIDRRHSTPRVLRVLELLWSKERRTGIRRFVELLKPEHWQNDVWYSDYIHHILKVYLTGFYLYHSCEALRKSLLQASGCTSGEFVRIWLYVSTLHDIGYIFDRSMTLKQGEALAFVQDHIQLFFAYYDRDMAEDLEHTTIAPHTIDKHSAARIFALLKVRLPILQDIDDFSNIEILRNSRPKRLIYLLDDLCNKTSIGTHGISNYYRACFATTPLKRDGHQPFYDHGITGALLLLYVGHMLHTLFNSLHRNLAQHENGRQKQLKHTGRIEVLKKMDEWGRENERLLETFEQTATAIALHNIHKRRWKTGELAEQIDLANFWIRLDREPQAFLLVLVDTLLNWDRPDLGALQLQEESLLSGDIELESDMSRILLNFPHNRDEYQAMIKRLKSILLPSQVDQWVAPLERRSLLSHPLALDRKLASYNQRVINRLRYNESDPFIDSQILPLNLRMEPSKLENRTYSIFQVAEQFAQKPIVLLGVPGIGKTSLVKHLALHYAQTGQYVPVFVDMALYMHGMDFLSLGYLRQSIDEAYLNILLEKGALAVIFDGLNEVDIDQRSNAARMIANFVNSYPQNQFFITCRTAEYPNLPADVRYFGVLPIQQNEVRDYLIEAIGPVEGAHLYAELSSTVRDLCSIPLMLAMLVYVCLGIKDQHPRHLPATRVALYQEFLSQLFRREDGLHPSVLPLIVREEFLIYIAQKMENKQVAIKIKKAAEWIEELYQKRFLNLGIKLSKVWHEILDLPPLVSSKPGPQMNIDISFMHQTFQEYYTACGLLQDLQQNKITLAEIAAYTLLDLETWSETLMLLVGMMDDASALIRTSKELAIEHKDHQILRLVAGCICEARYVDPSEVDSVMLHIIFEFKYGAVTFDYGLIESLKSIQAEKRSPDFPTRLIDDMERWVTKYAEEQGINLGTSISINVLLEYLESDDEMLVLNALSTLRSHPNRNRAVDQLIKKLHSATRTVREQTIITLGYLEEGASSATERLISIMKNRAESDLARVHAIAALSRIGDVKAIDAMTEYVCDHTNHYRETAAWAPLRIAKLHPEEVTILNQLKKVLFDDLLHEPETLEGKHVMGNVLYTLGELGSTEYASLIASWLNHQTDAYVIEDGIHTLGLIGGKDEVQLIRTHLYNEDFVVRMIAVQALVAIQKRLHQNIDALSDLNMLLNDKTAVVRESVAKLLRDSDIIQDHE